MNSVVKGLNVSVLVLLMLSALCITFNFSSYLEGFDNGFVEMQTPLETVAAFLGNVTYLIIHLFN